MHAVLLITEILCNVFLHITNNKSLAALARTCKAFNEPALDVLWAEIDPAPLIKCLARDIWVEDNNGIFHLQRNLRPEDWTVLQKYSCHVQKMVLQAVYPHQRFGGFLRVFSLLPNSLRFFPKLQEIVYNDGKAAHFGAFGFIHAILGPQLVRLDWRTHVDDIAKLSILLTLSLVCPYIRHASIYLPQSESLPQATDIISRTVCGWNHLHALQLGCGSVDRNAIYHLATLESLSSLELGVSTDQVNAFRSFGYPNNRVPFPNLQFLTLIFEDPSLDLITALYDTFREIPKSHSIRINIPETRSPIPHVRNILGGLFSILHDKCKNRSLQLEQFHITVFRRHDTFHAEDWDLALDMFKPLFVFHCMMDFSVDFLHPLASNNKTLREMAAAWPNLQKLNLNNYHGSCGLSAVTFEGLTTLIRLCPKLTELGMAMDVHTAMLPSVQPGQGANVCNRAITTLTISDSSINDPLMVATILSAILPCLRTLICHNPLWESEQGWAQVEDLLTAITIGRSRERNENEIRRH